MAATSGIQAGQTEWTMTNIETESFRLRPVRETDKAFYHTVFMDVQAVRNYLSGEVLQKVKIDEKHASCLSRWVENDPISSLVIENKATGTPVALVEFEPDFISGNALYEVLFMPADDGGEQPDLVVDELASAIYAYVQKLLDAKHPILDKPFYNLKTCLHRGTPQERVAIALGCHFAGTYDLHGRPHFTRDYDTSDSQVPYCGTPTASST